VRPDSIVVPPPALDKHLRLKKRVEELPVQQLIPQLADDLLRRVVGCQYSIRIWESGKW
jgi:hypothetical protein